MADQCKKAGEKGKLVYHGLTLHIQFLALGANTWTLYILMNEKENDSVSSEKGDGLKDEDGIAVPGGAMCQRGIWTKEVK